MKFLDTFEAMKQKRETQRLNLFITPNLQTWLLCFPPGDSQALHSHPADRTYYVITGRGIMKGLDETHELTPGKIISIPAHEYYEASNPHNDETLVLLGNSHKPTKEDLAKVRGMRLELDKATGKEIVYEHAGGRDAGKTGTLVE